MVFFVLFDGSLCIDPLITLDSGKVSNPHCRVKLAATLAELSAEIYIIYYCPTPPCLNLAALSSRPSCLRKVPSSTVLILLLSVALIAFWPR